jgi:hypothetical protein
MSMSPQHRKRLSFAAALAFIVLVVATGPVFASSGFAGGLGILALSAILPTLVLGTVAYIWASNDRDAARSGTADPPRR